MPYLTPQELPEGDVCRPLSIPDNPEWLAFFGGALTELTKDWNWEDSGGLTIAETVAKMKEIIEAWYDESCDACLLPEGGSVIRLNEDGHIEVLQDGEWVIPAEGDYYIPPPEPREGGEPEDQICLAAKNAVNVLEQMYESLSESWAENLSTAEALTAMIGVAVSLVGFEFAPIAFGIAAFVIWALNKLYTALEYLGADLWTEDFSRQMICFLIPCATNTDGVVTFDWDCFVNKLNSLADDFMLSELQLRLYLQVSVMMWFIGGADGLNLAGATTAITDAECLCAWCVNYDYSADNGGWVLVNIGGGFTPSFIGSYSSGAWRQTLTVTGGSGQRTVGAFIQKTWAAPATVEFIQVRYDKNNGTFNVAGNRKMQIIGFLGGTQVFDTGLSGSEANGTNLLATWTGSAVIDRIVVRDDSSYRSGAAGTDGVVTIHELTATGIGENPDGSYECL